MSTSEKKFKSKKQMLEDLSKNHSKSVKFRIRVQQEYEANKEIKEYTDSEEYEQYYAEKYENKPIQD